MINKPLKSRTPLFGLTLLFLIQLTADAQTIVRTDKSTRFLTDYSGSEVVAKDHPSVDFGIIENGDGFSHWGHVVLGPDDKFYYAIGDHRSDGIVILRSYDPKNKTDSLCIYSPDVTPNLADGKWHGRPVINPANGDMYLIGFYRGQVVKYNIYSKEVTNYGQPVAFKGWEEHIWDYKNNRLYGITEPDLLIYDTEKNSLIHSGQPFTDMVTDRRGRMIDNETGIFYATGGGKFYKYDPSTGVFAKLVSRIGADLRANTNTKEPDGSFWVSTSEGALYKFFPDEDRVVDKGRNAGNGEYVTFMERSPGGKYLYYISAAGEGHLIQYNTHTDSKKVIAQLTGYYASTYSYNIYGSFGGALSNDGSSIFIVCNGGTATTSNPAFFHIHIPESERSEISEIRNHTSVLKINAYPNPLKENSVISLELKKPGNVTLTITDITGTLLYTLHNGYLSEGQHQFELNTGEKKLLTGGIYFYSVMLNNERIVKRLVVL